LQMAARTFISAIQKRFDEPSKRPRPQGWREAPILGAGRSSRRDYLRAAQAYMLISMPTGTSTIFGVFQAIGVSSSYCGANLAQPRT
jgi:hypothetical protein